MKLTDKEIDEILDRVLEEESQKEGMEFDDPLLPDTTFFAFARKIESEIEKRVRKEYEPATKGERVWAKFKGRDYVVSVMKYKHIAEILFAYGHKEEIDVKDLADETQTGELDKIWHDQCGGRR